MVSAALPDWTGPGETVFIKVLDNELLYKPTSIPGQPDPPPPPPGPMGLSIDGQDVKGYGEFKIYIKLTPPEGMGVPYTWGSPPPSPNVGFNILDSADWDELGFAGIGGRSPEDFQALPYGGSPPPNPTSPNTYWATTYYFEGLYSEINLFVNYMLESGGPPPVLPEGPDVLEVDAWILMDN